MQFWAQTETLEAVAQAFDPRANVDNNVLGLEKLTRVFYELDLRIIEARSSSKVLRRPSSDLINIAGVMALRHAQLFRPP
jgi:hypothetical protein